MFLHRKRSRSRSHVARVAVRREYRPFLGGRILQSSFTVVGVVKTANGFAILLDELTRVELGVDHQGVGRGVIEQRLNNVHGRVVVQVFGRVPAFSCQPPCATRSSVAPGGECISRVDRTKFWTNSGSYYAKSAVVLTLRVVTLYHVKLYRDNLRQLRRPVFYGAVERRPEGLGVTEMNVLQPNLGGSHSLLRALLLSC